ncbi:hypothetical protein ACFE04_006548 [Oxalis oulophora]
MKESFLLLILATIAVAYTLQSQAHAAPVGSLIKHLSSVLKWSRSSSKTPQSDGSVLQFENGYLVETVVEGNEIGVVPYKIHVSEDGELYAVDEVNSNIVKITPPLSQYSRGRLVAGSFQGYTGHVDGKPSEARFNHPKGVTVDDNGNVYVADTVNLAIRKIGDAGVTTIAGGKSNVAGYRDGPSEDAKFSNDFDVVYIRPTCSLLVIDRGNAALRQISLNQEDCDYQSNSISTTGLNFPSLIVKDQALTSIYLRLVAIIFCLVKQAKFCEQEHEDYILMVVGAILVGYVTCILQQGFGPSIFSSMQPQSEKEFKDQSKMVKPISDLGWPSFKQLITDFSKLLPEALGNILLYSIPSQIRSIGSNNGSHKGLTPLKDSLCMPEDAPEQLVKGKASPAPVTENRQVYTPNTSEKYSEMKPPKMKSSSFKDPSLSSKHRSSKRQEYAEFYSGEVPPPGKSKGHKERTRHRRDKTGERVGTEPKPVEMKPVNYENSQQQQQQYDPYNMRNSKYGPTSSFRF